MKASGPKPARKPVSGDRISSVESAPLELLKLFDRWLFQPVLESQIAYMRRTPFSSLGFRNERDTVREQTLCLTANPFETSVITLKNFPDEEFCIQWVSEMVFIVHTRLECINPVIRAPLHTMGRKAKQPSRREQLQILHWVEATQAFLGIETQRALQTLQTILNFCWCPQTQRFLSSQVLERHDIALALARALWAVRCLELDRSLMYLLLCGVKGSLLSALPVLTDELAKLLVRGIRQAKSP